MIFIGPRTLKYYLGPRDDDTHSVEFLSVLGLGLTLRTKKKNSITHMPEFNNNIIREYTEYYVKKPTSVLRRFSS